MKKGAIFDMDGTLLDTEKFFTHGWVYTAKKFGREIIPSLGTAMSGASPPNCRKILAAHYPGIDAEAYSEAVYEYVRNEKKKATTPMKGVKEILDFFREEDVPMAVASSSDRKDIEENLRAAGIREYFRAIVGGDQVEKGKPDPEIFLRAAKALELSPEDCYIFEDSFNGIRAANAAGGCAVMIPDQVQPDEEIKGISKVYEDFLRILEDIRAEKM